MSEQPVTLKPEDAPESPPYGGLPYRTPRQADTADTLLYEAQVELARGAELLEAARARLRRTFLSVEAAEAVALLADAQARLDLAADGLRILHRHTDRCRTALFEAHPGRMASSLLPASADAWQGWLRELAHLGAVLLAVYGAVRLVEQLW